MWHSLTSWLTNRPSRAVRRSARPPRFSFRPRLRQLERRDVPAVTVPTGFAYYPVVASGLSSPTSLETLSDGRLFVALQNGTIRVVQNDQLLPDPLVTLNAQVDSVWERGLLGMTLDPNFASNGYLYVYYTAAAPTSHNRVSRLTVSGNAVVPGSEQIIYELPDIAGAIYHMGGALQFSPDGKLFLSVGDHQQPATAQSTTSLFGKVLRINSDGSIPTDNPFYTTATGVYRAIWAYGLRNPFTKAFDPLTGKLFINDVGNSSWEEVNVGAAGANFGWPTTEGDFNQAAYPTLTRPLYAYQHGPGCAITGGAFYSPQTNVFPAAYYGKYFYADFCTGEINRLDPTTGATTGFVTGTSYPIDLRVSSSGALYFINRGAQTGGQPNTGGIGKIAYIDQQSPTITQQPGGTLVSIGETASFSMLSAGTNPLTYQWERSLSGTPTWAPVAGATTASITVSATPLSANGDRYRAVVTNAFGTATSNPAVLSVTSNVRPSVTINAPVNAIHYNAGQTISFAGTGNDPEDGTLPASKYHWQIDNYTGTVPRPVELPNNGDGYMSGSFVIPTDGIYKPANVYYRIFLTVTDSGGLSKTTFVEIYPNTAVVTLNSLPANLGLMLDEQPIASPTSFTGVVNFNRLIEAPQFTSSGTTTYQFVSWSDGGARQHTIATPAANATYTATYQAVAVTFISDLPFVGTPVNGWGPVERDRSNGEQGAADGAAITLQGTTYAKGLGVHADSEVIYNLAGQYGAFIADVGIDDEVGNGGSVIFQAWVDGVKLYDSGTMNGTSLTKSLLVDVTNKNQLRLVVTNNGDGNGSDHADWANGRLTVIPLGAPNAPTNLLSQAISTTQIGLSWSDTTPAVNAPGSYLIQRSPNGTSGWTQIATTNTPGYTANGLTAGTTYYFRVRSQNTIGYSTYSNTASSTTNLVASHTIDYGNGFTPANTAGVLTPNGSALIDAPTSRLRLTTSGTGNPYGSVFHGVPQNITSFSTTYTYYKSGAAEGITFTIQRDPRALTALGGGNGSLGYGAANPITPSFAAAINISNAHPYGTEFLTNGTVDFNYAQTNINTSAASPVTVTVNYASGVLTATYRQGAAVDVRTMTLDLPALLGGNTAYVGFTGAASGNGATQDILYWTFDAALPPAAPANVQTALSGYSGSSTASAPLAAHITWSATPGANSYKIERKLTPGGTYAQIGTTTGTSFDDSGLAPAASYFYRIRATNVVGDGVYSLEAPVVTPSLAPTPTNGGTTLVTTTAIALSWTDNADNEAGFQILRSVNQGAFALLAAVPASTSPAPSVAAYTDAGLTPGTRYDYRIQAFNLSGANNSASLVTATRTLAPTGLAASAQTGQVTLNWSAPFGAASYKIYRGTSPGGQSANPIASEVTALAYIDTGLTPGTTYYYTITAENLAGESAPSTEASATPLPQPGVQSVQVNGGLAQRSLVNTLTVTFNRPVLLAANTFALTRPAFLPTSPLAATLSSAPVAGQGRINVSTTTNALGQTVATLTFATNAGSTTTSADGVDFGSLSDGTWVLTVTAAGVTTSSGATMPADYVTPNSGAAGSGRIYRLYGDNDGDADVDITDFSQFRDTFTSVSGSAGPVYMPAFDFDSDGDVDISDLSAVRQRFTLIV